MSYCDSPQYRLDREAYVTYVERSNGTDIPYKRVEKDEFDSYIRSLKQISWHKSEGSTINGIQSYKQWYTSKSRTVAEIWVSIEENTEYRSYWVRK